MTDSTLIMLRATLSSLAALALAHAIPATAAPGTASLAPPTAIADVPPITADMMDWCGSGIDADDLYQYGLPGGSTLWQHLCPVAGVNILSRWYLVAPSQVGATPLNLPDEGGATSFIDGLTLANATYDADSHLLQSIRYDAANGNCGTMMLWRWTGRAFQLIERAEMHVCDGERFADWPLTYQLPPGAH